MKRKVYTFSKTYDYLLKKINIKIIGLVFKCDCNKVQCKERYISYIYIQFRTLKCIWMTESFKIAVIFLSYVYRYSRCP